MKNAELSQTALFLLLAAAPLVADGRGGVPQPGGMSPTPDRSFSPRQPVVIRMGRGSSGWHNHNFPSPKSSWPAGRTSLNRRPSYGRLKWTTPAQNKAWGPWTPAVNGGAFSRPALGIYSASGLRAGVVVHRHPYTQGFVRQKLRDIGVTYEPALITDRAEMVHTDRKHSTPRLPREGPGHAPLRATAVSPRHFNDPFVRRRMAELDGADWSGRIDRFNASETQPNHYYWHQDNGLNYCHYIDSSGYHWWGWYSGSRFFWTRVYAGRWWWYDQDYNRWCFWNDDNWWWQDPYHIGDLYCYDNDVYVPCNSEDDQEVVTAPSDSGERVYDSPDGACEVKVAGDSQDAFLYDHSNPPHFDPVYLASGVIGVEFSSASDGRPLEIILKIDDGSFDMFDGFGNPYNPGTYAAEQAAQP